MLRLAFVFLLTAGQLSLSAQPISVGVIGGVRATGDFQYAAASESRNYLVGPSIELTLPLGFSIEVDALYQRQGYTAGNSTPLYSSSIHESDNTWEFPLLVRYRIPVPLLRPFLEAGWAPRILHGDSDINNTFLSQVNPQIFTSTLSRAPTTWPATHGLVLGGGIQFRAGRLQLAPEIRYTHWNRQAVSGFFADGPSYGSSQNQVDILLGIRWWVVPPPR